MTERTESHYEHSGRADETASDAGVSRPLKVVFLGAGSGFFGTLFTDILNIPGADKGEIALVDVDVQRLELAEQLGRKIVEKMSKDWTVTSSADRRKILAGADYIINCIEVSGVDCVRFDNDIPAKYGVSQCIGDTIGPGGLFKALRTVPVFIEVLKDLEELAPNAVVLNYTNPMSIMCLAASRVSNVRVVGICHSVQGTSRLLADYAGVPYDEMKWQCGGINHLSWFTELSHNGRDLYPVLRDKAVNDKDTYEKDPVRFDMMLHFGYFITESSGHLSEYIPYYRNRPELIEKYCRKGYLGESGFYARDWPSWRSGADKWRREQIAGEKEIHTHRSREFASYTIQALESGSPYTAYFSVPNNGLIDNLPPDGVVEVACRIDGDGITPQPFGSLPPQCAAICDSNMRMFDLAATACIERLRQAAIHALMLDPLTAAVCCPAEIKQMTEELFEAERDYLLPGF